MKNYLEEKTSKKTSRGGSDLEKNVGGVSGCQRLGTGKHQAGTKPPSRVFKAKTHKWLWVKTPGSPR